MADIQLFNQTIDETPSISDRLAYGRPGVNALNMTIGGLLTLIDAGGVAAIYANEALASAMAYTDTKTSRGNPTLDQSGKDAGLTVNLVYGIKTLNITTIALLVTSTYADVTFRKLGVLNFAPPVAIPFPGTAYSNVLIKEPGAGQINADGTIYIATGFTGQFVFNFTFQMP